MGEGDIRPGPCISTQTHVFARVDVLRSPSAGRPAGHQTEPSARDAPESLASPSHPPTLLVLLPDVPTVLIPATPSLASRLPGPPRCPVCPTAQLPRVPWPASLPPLLPGLLARPPPRCPRPVINAAIGELGGVACTSHTPSKLQRRSGGVRRCRGGAEAAGKRRGAAASSALAPLTTHRAGDRYAGGGGGAGGALVPSEFYLRSF